MHSLTLKIDSVQLEFDGRKVLRDVYLDCSCGEIVGLLGRNGCGKSSLLKIIFGTLTAQYKYVAINDKFVAKGYKHGVAYLPQHHFLPRYASINQLAGQLVDPLFMPELAAMPIYQQHAHKRCEQLSGGEQRQFEMLMILFSNADFVLMDEPFTHVTPVQSNDFKKLMRKVAQHKGIIVTDHQYYNILEVSDRVILMNDGTTRPIYRPEQLVEYRYLSGL